MLRQIYALIYNGPEVVFIPPTKELYPTKLD